MNRKEKKAAWKQKNRNAAWPAEKGGHQQCVLHGQRKRADTSSEKCCMASGKRADTNSDRKGGHIVRKN